MVAADGTALRSSTTTTSAPGSQASAHNELYQIHVLLWHMSEALVASRRTGSTGARGPPYWVQSVRDGFPKKADVRFERFSGFCRSARASTIENKDRPT